MKAKKPFIVPVFLPHEGCRHRCVFCNQYAITGKKIASSFHETAAGIEEYLRFKGPHRSDTLIAFYGGNFLGLPPEKIHALLDSVLPFVRAGKVKGIRFSTRPDTIHADTLDLLDGYPIDAVELGAQSMDDGILAVIRRGHGADATSDAVHLLKQRHIRVGIQLMIGLPCEDRSSCWYTGRQVVRVAPDFVRIYPTVVIDGSLLADWFRKGSYLPLTLEESVLRTKSLYLLFQSNDIRVVRMGLQPSKDLDRTLVAGPYHSSFGELVFSEIFFDKAKKALRAAGPLGKICSLAIHPRSASKMRGPSNRNMKRLQGAFALDAVRLLSDPSLAEDAVAVRSTSC